MGEKMTDLIFNVIMSIRLVFNRRFVFWQKNSNAILLLILMVCSIFKLILGSDQYVNMIYSPHDDGLYVMRAFSILNYGDFGEYDSRLLVKNLGFSLYLSLIRLIGVPYLLSLNILLIIAVFCLFNNFRKISLDPFLALLICVTLLLTPVAFDHQWIRVLREPLSTILFMFLFSSTISVFACLEKGAIKIWAIVALSFFSTLLYITREEDVIILTLPIIILAVRYLFFERNKKISFLKKFFPLVFIFYGFIALTQISLSFFIKHNYGNSVVNDFGSGEFPKLVASIRSIKSEKNNRHVSIPQESLNKLRLEVPEFIPVLDKMPPPSITSYSCERFKVCSEWTNGWHYFWLKDAAYQAGVTPNHDLAQQYFRLIRKKIDFACENGRLECHRNGGGLFPLFDFYYLKDFFIELQNAFSMFLQPGLMLYSKQPDYFNVSNDYGSKYQYVTMSSKYTTKSNDDLLVAAWRGNLDVLNSLEYYRRNPDVALNSEFGLKNSAQDGALIHYQNHGLKEGRKWGVSSIVDSHISNFSEVNFYNFKFAAIEFYSVISKYVILFGYVFWVAKLFAFKSSKFSTFECAATVVVIFVIMKIFALAYVSIFMGSLDVRLYFPMNILIFSIMVYFSIKFLKGIFYVFSKKCTC